MQTVTGGRQPIGGGIRKEYDGGGADVLVTAEGAGRVQGVRERDGGRVSGIPLDDAAREGEGGTVDLERLIHGGRRTKNISDRVPDEGGAEGLPSGGLTRKGWDTDGDEDAFLQPVCPGHRDHLGGGKPPTPKVLTMRHAGPVEVIKWETS